VWGNKIEKKCDIANCLKSECDIEHSLNSGIDFRKLFIETRKMLGIIIECFINLNYDEKQAESIEDPASFYEFFNKYELLDGIAFYDKIRDNELFQQARK